jgi:hypothetical protein
MLSGPTSPLEGSPTTLGPPPWKYISSSRFDTPHTKPGIFFAAITWAYSDIQHSDSQTVRIGTYNYIVESSFAVWSESCHTGSDKGEFTKESVSYNGK